MQEKCRKEARRWSKYEKVDGDRWMAVAGERERECVYVIKDRRWSEKQQIISWGSSSWDNSARQQRVSHCLFSPVTVPWCVSSATASVRPEARKRDVWNQANKTQLLGRHKPSRTDKAEEKEEGRKDAVRTRLKTEICQGADKTPDRVKKRNRKFIWRQQTVLPVSYTHLTLPTKRIV